MRKYRIVCTWPGEEWLVQECIEKDDHTTEWVEVHRFVGKKQNGYDEAKNWLKDNDK